VTPSTTALLLAACTLLAPALTAQSPSVQQGSPQQQLLVDIDHRPAQSLNGDWHIIADPYRAGISSFHGAPNPNGFFKDEVYSPDSNKLVEYSFSKSPTIKVPGDWNTQAEWLRLYEGPLWYQRHFDYTPPSNSQPGQRAFLHIGAANYRSNVFVNGKQVCEHEGGFTPFDCEITGVVKRGQNDAVILVDNTRIADGVPTLKTDWYNYGGLTRDVSVVTIPATFIDDYELHLDRATRSTIEGYVHIQGAEGATAAATPVTVSIPELHLTATLTTDANGRAAVNLPTKNLSLWSPSSPKLYKITLKAGSGSTADALPDTLEDEVGFRTIETRGSEILLNGQPIFLRGVCIHAEAPIRTGRANTQKDVDTLLGWVKELGGNYARLAHYPHDERMTRTADKLGILIWSEVPVYWAEQFDNESVFNKSKQQLTEEIRRDRNKASVILWSIANETPNTPARTAFLTRSAELVHGLDPTRLVTAALLVHGDLKTKYIDDPLGKALDVIGFNEYIGWYEGKPEDADGTEWKVSYDKPLIVSEFGGGAKAGLHGPETQRWTEEYQSNLYRHQLGMLNRITQLRGMSPWILMDFRSPVRQLPGIQDGFNRKGLISDQGEKKAAFSIVQKAYKDNMIGKAQ